MQSNQKEISFAICRYICLDREGNIWITFMFFDKNGRTKKNFTEAKFLKAVSRAYCQETVVIQTDSIVVWELYLTV